ncbi:MAG: hypothetical protein KAJ62_01815 [Desulfobacteraceae bacterium]|nr:hypothetical protein [Desulfobacteraceae bacterium]
MKKKMVRCVLFAGVPAFLFYGFSLLWLRIVGFSFIEILRDPAQQSGQSNFLGFLSSIGVWLWVSSAAICFYSSTIKTVIIKDSRRELLILLGILSFILAVDDFFMIHDRHGSEKWCYVLYAFFSGSLLLRHYKTIIEVDGFAFLLACFLLALSILTDRFQGNIFSSYSYGQVFEEGFKFIGAGIWLYFCCRVASSHNRGKEIIV